MLLYIDQKPATLKEGTTIKFTRENPYFTGAGDYTLDVTLPMKGCPGNRHIFGPIGYRVTSPAALASLRLPFLLQAPPLTLQGTAIVTEVTDEEVKVQLTAGNSALRHELDTSKTKYISQLDLGRAWDELGDIEAGAGGEYYEPGKSLTEAAAWMHAEVKGTIATSGRKILVDDILHGQYPQTSCLCFPIYSTTDERMANRHGAVRKPHEGDYVNTWSPVADPGLNLHKMLIAPQPYLLHIISRVCRSLGYTLELAGSLQQNPIFQTFIANTRATLELALMLPRWTPEELIRQVENTFGLCFIVKEGKNVQLTTRADYYTSQANTIYIQKATDTQTADISPEEDQATNSASGNVDYDWPEQDDILHLPEDVSAHATHIELPSLAAIQQHFNRLTTAERQRSEILYTATDTHKQYAILSAADDPDNFRLTEVNQLGPLLRNTEDTDITTTLKIIPASYILQQPEGDNTTQAEGPADTTTFNEAEDSQTGFPILKSPDTTLAARNYYSVNDAINPQEESQSATTEEQPDYLLVASNTADIHATWNLHLPANTIPVPACQPYIRDQQTNLPTIPQNLSYDGPTTPGHYLLRQPAGSSDTPGIADAITASAQIDTRIVHQLTVTDRSAIDPTAIYQINSRRYACQKIEINIDQNGLQPEKKLYLYEL
ncbi:MAG: hypothetical protein ACI353_06540 [Alloprevotella sp.]